jgi:ectoine hydroxylase-related dioxygenase (phytanoyl-CoA dioxygenase family)
MARVGLTIATGKRGEGGGEQVVPAAAVQLSSHRMEDHCGYLAVLPNDPSCGAAALEVTCRGHRYGSLGLRWLDARPAELVHPQLPNPLVYLEIAAWVQLPTAGLSEAQRDAASVGAFEVICAALMASSLSGAVVGNAELVHSVRCPIPLLPTALPAGNLLEMLATGEAADGTRAAALFQQYGLVVLRNAVQSDSLSQLRIAVQQRFGKCLHALKDQTQRGRGVHFKEIMQRDSLRYDCQLNVQDEGSEHWLPLAATEGPWLPVIRELLAGDCRLYRCGVVVSLPGAGEQYWHSDGQHVGASSGWQGLDRADEPAWQSTAADTSAPPHAICVFVPLVNLERSNGYTEFWAGSQHYRGLLEKKGLQSLPGGTDGLMREGECLLYDFRTLHRGNFAHWRELASFSCDQRINGRDRYRTSSSHRCVR